MTLLITILATWRIASLIAREDGPWNIFLRLRLKLGFEYNVKSELIAETELARGIECIWCNSLWIAPFTVLPLVSDPLEWIFHVLAVSTGVIVVEKLAG